MACADVLRLAGVDISGVSLSSCVRLALNILIETAIKHGRIPKRDGFEYEQLLAPYKRSNIKTKVQVGQVLAKADMLRVGADMPVALSTLPESDELTEEEIQATRERTLRALEADDPKAAARLRRDLRGGEGTSRKRVDPRTLRRDELKFRSEQDPANMTSAEFRELRRLQTELGGSK